MLGQRDELGGGAERALPLRVVEPDPLADPGLLDALADRVDGARAVLVGDDQLGLQRNELARPADLPVGRVDAGDGDADAHLTRSGYRVGELAELDPARIGAGEGVGGGAHGHILKIP